MPAWSFLLLSWRCVPPFTVNIFSMLNYRTIYCQNNIVYITYILISFDDGGYFFGRGIIAINFVAESFIEYPCHSVGTGLLE